MEPRYRTESLESLSRSPVPRGSYSRYSKSARISRMAAVVALSVDSSDIVSEADAAAALPGGPCYKVLYAAVKAGLMKRVLLPKTRMGRTLRTTFAATPLGAEWLAGYRRWLSESPLPMAPRPPREGRPRRPGECMVPLSEVRARKDARLAARVAEAMSRLEARMAMRSVEARAYEEGRMQAPPA